MTDTKDRRHNDTKDRIAEHLSNGLTVLQIARLLGISPSAIYKHIKRYDLSLPTEKGGSLMTTLALWVHFYLAIAVVLDHGRTRNAIWGELRAVLCGIAVVSLWVALDWSL